MLNINKATYLCNLDWWVFCILGQNLPKYSVFEKLWRPLKRMYPCTIAANWIPNLIFDTTGWRMMLGQLQSARASNYMQTRQHSIRSLRWKLFERMVGHVKLGKLFHMDVDSALLRGKKQNFFITIQVDYYFPTCNRDCRDFKGAAERRRRRRRTSSSQIKAATKHALPVSCYAR